MNILEKYKKYASASFLAEVEQSAYQRLVESDKLNSFFELILNVISTSTAITSILGAFPEALNLSPSIAALSIHSLNLTAAVHSLKSSICSSYHLAFDSYITNQLALLSGKHIKEPYIQNFEILSLDDTQIILHREKELGNEQKRLVRNLIQIQDNEILVIKSAETAVDNSLITNSIAVSVLLNAHKKDPQAFDIAVKDYTQLKEYLYTLKYPNLNHTRDSETSGEDSSIKFQGEEVSEQPKSITKYETDKHITAISQLLFVFQTLTESENTLTTQTLFEEVLDELFKTFDLHLVASYYAMLSQFSLNSSTQACLNQAEFIEYLNLELQNTLKVYELLLDDNFLQTYKENSENFKHSKARLERFVETFKKFDILKQEFDLTIQKKREFEEKLEAAKILLSNFSQFSADQQIELSRIIAKNDSSFKTVQRFIDDNLHMIVDDYEWFKNIIEENSKVSETKIV